MALLEIPVWTIPPDWADPLTETLEWKTGIFASTVGAEQRQSLRLSPRRALEYVVRPTGAWRTYYDALLSTQLQVEFYTPLWHDRGTLTANVAIGDTTFTVKGDRTELATMDIAFIPGNAPYLYDILEVTSASLVGLDTQFVCAPFTNGWKKGNSVFAAAPAAIVAQPTFTRLSDNALESVIHFDLLKKNDWAGTFDFPFYQTFPVVELGTNENDTQSGSYFRYSATLDNSTGIPIFKDFGGIGFPGFSGINFVNGLGSGVALRSLLYALRGKRNAAWFVYPTTDFTMAQTIGSGSASLVVERSGFTDLGGPTTGRKDIRIRLHNGTTFYRHIDGSNIRSDNVTETLNIDMPLFVTVNPADVAQISFMGIGRLDQDLITLTHTTDTEGVCATALAYKLMPHLRNVADWNPPPFPFTAMEHCMVASAVGAFEMIYDGGSGPAFAATQSVPSGGHGTFDGTGASMLFSVWVDAGRGGQGILFDTTSLTTPDLGDHDAIQLNSCNLYVELIGATGPGAGGIFAGFNNPSQVQIGASIWPPLTPGRHHVMISVDSIANRVQCAVDDVIVPNNSFGFGEVWFDTDFMGSPTGSTDIVGLARNSTDGMFPGGGAADEVCANFLWVKRTPSFVDISDPANRRPFINADLTAAVMADSGVAIGLTPDIFLELKFGDAADQWLLNRGSGKQFIVSAGGALALCDKPPPG